MMKSKDLHKIEIQTTSMPLTLWDAVYQYKNSIKKGFQGAWLHQTFSGNSLEQVKDALEAEGEIVYGETGLHVIQGICVGVPTNPPKREGDYIIITLDHSRLYVINLNLPAELSPPNAYPKLMDNVTIYAEGIEEVNSKHYGYSEICHLTDEKTAEPNEVSNPSNDENSTE